ncbi:GNAT family N-acetyltransferase [Pedobacter rhizosphaerae]|uniref:Ribosomal protein S18 acetylase RimI n=1 Tax=Pedobacter rhizosphaerae TaxID=390241 RepID=A0A1H9W7P9_9SPHI|nr:GNAT family N-acetyltransferase [Pedobacter rhizosphaerae]SES29928.1 Ribosomal protein S18 acetylase RimI [Pedobacter rhizosphaerae]
MANITIEQVKTADVSRLHHIGRATFSETFSDLNTPEDMNQYLVESFSINKLMSELRNPGSQFYFAVADGKDIGYLKVNFRDAQTEKLEGNTLEIERIYVLKDFHGQQVGQLLYNKAIQVASEFKADYVWLGVWEENQRAINFYRKNGFAAFGSHAFQLGADEQTDILMKKVLNIA